MHKFPATNSSRNTSVLARVFIVFSVLGCFFYLFTWQQELPDHSFSSSAADKESMKQHLLEVMRSFTMSGHDALPTVPSQEYIDALATAVADKLRVMITNQIATTTSVPSQQKSSQQYIESSVISSSTPSAGKAEIAKSSITFATGVLRPLQTMEELGTKTGTDKVYHHAYFRFYPLFLEPLRLKNNVEGPIKMLEIGYLHGQSWEM
jgi:hypothetical protein